MDGYGLKYKVSFYSVMDKNSFNELSIFKKDYSGSASPFQISEGSISISLDWDDWDSRVIGRRLSFILVNNDDNFFVYSELMFAVEREFILEFKNTDLPTATTTVLFEGYLNVEAISQKYLRYQNLNITASSFLSKLEHVVMPSIENLKNESFINIISECLSLIGFSYPIRVCIPLGLIQDYGIIFGSANHTILNRAGIYKEVFWKDDYQRMNSLEVILSILKAFDLYLYWWDGKWYVEHSTKLWATSKTYIEYQVGVSYGYTGIPLGHDYTIVTVQRDLHSMLFVEMTQSLSAYVGLRQLIIKISEYQKFFNYVSNYFVNAEPYLYPIGVPIATIRQWKYYNSYTQMSWQNHGIPATNPITFNTIKNAIGRSISDVRLFGDTAGAPLRPRGLSTFFKIRVLPDSKITIKFKYGFDKNSYMNYQKTDWNNDDENDREESFLSYAMYDWFFQFYIMATAFPDAAPYITPMYAIKCDINTGQWSINVLSNNPPEQADELFYTSYVQVKGTEFDYVNDTVTVEINVPIGELLSSYIDNVGWDYGFVFTIGTETIRNNRSPYRYVVPNVTPRKYIEYTIKRQHPAQIAYFGDVTIESTENTELVEPNVYEGAINENYLSKEELTIDIADIKAITYKNAILTGENYEERTTKWVNYLENKMYSLVEWLFYFRFRQRNVTRRIVTGNAQELSLLRPFMCFYDSKDPYVANRKFLLTGFSYYPEISQYKDLHFIEYDTNTPVTMEVDGVVDDGTITTGE